MAVKMSEKNQIVSVNDKIKENDNQIKNSNPNTNRDSDDTSCFKISVQTGDQSEQRTKFSIHIAFVSDDGVTNFYLLNRRMMPVFYIRGTTQKFIKKTPYIDSIKHIIVKVSPVNVSWYMKCIRVENMKTGKAWETKSSRWFSRDKCDGKMVRLLPMQNVKRKGMKHVLAVKIISDDHRACKNYLYITCFGKNGKTSQIPLTNGYFVKENSVYRYLINMTNIGEILKIRVGTFPIPPDKLKKKKQRNVTFLITPKTRNCGSIEICEILLINLELHARLFYSKESHTLDFVKDFCIGNKNENKEIEIFNSFGAAGDVNNELSVVEEEIITYDITISNHNPKYTNSSSTMYLQLLGRTGKWSKVYKFTDVKHKTGENADKYRIIGKNLGTINKIKVWHNKDGVAGGWHLDHVKVIRYLTKNDILTVMSTLKKQGKLPPGMTFDNKTVVLHSDVELNEPFNDLLNMSFICKTSKNTFHGINQSGDTSNDQFLYNINASNATYENNKTNTEKFPQKNIFSLPFAEQLKFICQTWLTLEKGDKTFQKIIPLAEKQLLYSSVKLNIMKNF